MLYYERSGTDISLSDDDLKKGLSEALKKAAPLTTTKKVLTIPPDITRLHSKAGVLTLAARDYYGKTLTDIIPALGTHYPMSSEEIDEMFPGIDHSLF